jgi:hypothetical protein
MTAEPGPRRLPTIEDVDYAAMALDAAQLTALVSDRGECVFAWTTTGGYPMAVVVAYVYRNGVFWTNCTGRKKRVAALRARPGSAVVISKYGQTATFKGNSVVHSRDDHDWEQLTQWFYPALAESAPDPEDPFARGLLRFLNAPHQAIIETPARLVVSFDFPKFGTALQAAVTAGL